MRKWKRRFQTAWKVLTGKQCLLADATQKIVYVQNSGPDGKIVQLVPWCDQILALDNNGSILLIVRDAEVPEIPPELRSANERLNRMWDLLSGADPEIFKREKEKESDENINPIR